MSFTTTSKPATLVTPPLIQFARFMARNSSRKSSHVIKKFIRMENSNGHHKSCNIQYPLFSHSFFISLTSFHSCNGKILQVGTLTLYQKLNFTSWAVWENPIAFLLHGLESNKDGYKIIKTQSGPGPAQVTRLLN